MNKAYIFIDPDGTSKKWLYLIVHANTSVFYSTQCAGLLNEIRTSEGYLIPLSGITFDTKYDINVEIENLENFFQRKPFEFQHNTSALHSIQHGFLDLGQLKRIIENITVWFSTSQDAEDQRQHLSIDENKIGEITEAWIPVISPYGKAVLIWKNSD